MLKWQTKSSTKKTENLFKCYQCEQSIKNKKSEGNRHHVLEQMWKVLNINNALCSEVFFKTQELRAQIKNGQRNTFMNDIEPIEKSQEHD